MIYVTEHFELSEFACRRWRDTSGIWHASVPYPQQWIEERLEKLCGVLETVRAEIGLPLVVLCGYRTHEFNEYLRSTGHNAASGSQHMQGTAADIYCHAIAAPKLHDVILQLQRDGKLPDLGGLGHYPTFTHVDVRDRHGGQLARWNH